MGFDYGWTCPDIDKGIDQIKNDIENYFIDIMDECCPLIEGEQKKKIVNDYVNNLYNDLESVFEDVRKSNEDMRRDADNQIERLDSEVDDMKSIINDMEIEIGSLTEQIEELQNEINN